MLDKYENMLLKHQSKYMTFIDNLSVLKMLELSVWDDLVLLPPEFSKDFNDFHDQLRSRIKLLERGGK